MLFTLRSYLRHGGDLRSVPIANILVTRGCTLDHPPHVRDLHGTPRSNVLVECGCAIEHILMTPHPRYLAL
jgi:hypothetical protein